MTDGCTLCDLPVSNPVTGTGVDGEFCCRGCLEVARTLGDLEDITASDVREHAETVPDEQAPRGAAETFLTVEGMHCTTCEAFVGLRGESLDGIHTVDASYATDTVRVRYDPKQITASELPDALSGFGYTARGPDERDGERSHDEETFLRLTIGAVLAMLVMPWYVFFLYPRYVGIDTGILTVDLTTQFGLYFPMAFVGLLTSGVVFYSGWPILRGAYVSLRTRQPNMDLLLAVAILSAFTYSTVALATGSIHLYYDVSIAIVLVVTAGTYYEGKLKRQATGLLSDLTAMQLTEAIRRRDDGSTETVAVDDLEPGDELVVRPGDRIPVDGTVIEGVAAVDEAVLTGESLPKTKRPGDHVIGGGVVTDSALIVEVDAGAESTLDQITSLLWAVQSDRPGVQRFADRLATVFVPGVLTLGIAVLLWRVAVGQPITTALLAGLTVLVAACPCAMGLATPLAIAGGLRDALRRGIVVGNSTLFEAAPDVETIVFDKTGTLTTGEMSVREIVGDSTSMAAAAAVERRSSHPVAAAIVDHVTETPETESPTAAPDGGDAHRSMAVTDFQRHPGEGVSANVDGETVVVGTPQVVERIAGPLSTRLRTAVTDARDNGHLPVVVGRGDRARAVAVVGDRDRQDWRDVLDEVADKRVVILSGDDESAVAPFRDHPAVDEVFAGVPPDGKVATVRELQANGPTAMVGDGTNDAPALGAADVGIAIAGTARAADAADVVLVEGALTDVPAVFSLATATRRRIRENVAWAFCYNLVAIPLAALGILNPLLAALAMATSSVLVVTNSRRRLL